MKRRMICVLSIVFLIASCGGKTASHINEKIEPVAVPVPVIVPVTPKILLDITEPNEILFVDDTNGLSTAVGDGGLGVDLDQDNKLIPYPGIPMEIQWENIAETSKTIAINAYGDNVLCHDIFSFDPSQNLILVASKDIKSLLVCHVDVAVSGSYQDTISKENKKFDVVINPTFAVYAKNQDPAYLYLKAYTQLSSTNGIAKWLKDKNVRRDGLDLSYDPKKGTDGIDVENIDSLIGVQSLTGINVSGLGLRDIKALSYMPHLQKIDVSGIKIEASDLSVLEKLPELKSLQIRNLNLKDIKVVTDHLKNLVELDISRNKGIEDLEDIANLKNLEVLKASDIGLKSFKKFEGMMQVMDLDISKNDFSGASADDVQDLADLYNLHVLNVSESHLSDKFLNIYFNYISSRNNLKTFIDRNTFNPALLMTKEFCQNQMNDFSNISSLSKLTSLEYLDISNNGCTILDDKKPGFVYLGLTSTQMLSDMTHLKYLDISNTTVKYVSYLDSLSDLSVLKIKDIFMNREACQQQLTKHNAKSCLDLNPGNMKNTEFTTAGTYSFVVPENVYSISIEGCSAGDGGQGGQGGQGGYSVMPRLDTGVCLIPLKRYKNPQIEYMYYCTESNLPSKGSFGQSGGLSYVSNLFSAEQTVSEKGHNGLCSGGAGGTHGNAGFVAIGDWGNSSIPADEMPKNGSDGNTGASKKYTEQKNIAVTPGQVLNIVVGSAGQGGAGTNGTKNGGCAPWEAGSKPTSGPRICGGNATAGTQGQPGTSGYLKISWIDKDISL